MASHPEITLRALRADDVSAVFENANNPNVARYLREIFPSPYTMADAQWWVDEGCKLPPARTWAIEYQGQLIGCAGSTPGDNEYRYACEIGFWIGEPYWGKGLTTEVVAQLTQNTLSEFDVSRIFALVAGPNKASICVLEKNGFELEGVMKNNFFLRGEMYDEYVYAIHRD